MLAGRSDLIAAAPSLLAEAERALPALRQDALRPASPAEIMHVLSMRFAVYPQPDRTDSEWAAWWSDYTAALDDLPASAIEAGMAAYVKAPDSEFFPKPGRIRELARTVPNRLAAAVQTAAYALHHAQVRATDRPEEGAVATPVEGGREAVRTMLADFHKRLAENSPPPKPERPPVSGPVDERGLTQTMRDHMASRS